MPRPKNRSLVIVCIRLRKQDVAEARRIAKRQAIPYGHVIRGWIAACADKEKARG